MIQIVLKGLELRLKTAPTLFSPRAVDPGTLAMLDRVDFEPGDKVLDLGCGYGVVGILAAKLLGGGNVVLLDSDPLAVEVTAANLVANNVADARVVLSDGLRQLDETGFTKILCNPPYHADFSVPKHFIEKGFNRLAIGGRMVMVTMRELWYRKKLEAIFGGATIQKIGAYSVVEAIRTKSQYANKA